MSPFRSAGDGVSGGLAAGKDVSGLISYNMIIIFNLHSEMRNEHHGLLCTRVVSKETFIF